MVAAWRKSRRSMSNGNCAEVGTGPGVIGVRDSKLGEDSPVIEYSLAAWRAFTGDLRS